MAVIKTDSTLHDINELTMYTVDQSGALRDGLAVAFNSSLGYGDYKVSPTYKI